MKTVKRVKEIISVIIITLIVYFITNWTFPLHVIIDVSVLRLLVSCGILEIVLFYILVLCLKIFKINYDLFGENLFFIIVALYILFALLLIFENQAQLHLFRYGNALEPEVATAQYKGIIFKIIPDAFYEEGGCSDILSIMSNIYMAYGAFIVSLSLMVPYSIIASGYSISLFCGIGIYFTLYYSGWYHFAVIAFVANVIIISIPMQFFEKKLHR